MLSKLYMFRTLMSDLMTLGANKKTQVICSHDEKRVTTDWRAIAIPVPSRGVPMGLKDVDTLERSQDNPRDI
ncbi:hypothetical protein TNCV_1388581 [Trichonephila clavipes]|nr:hypothetical protein TNCV_1388581 [Trichonephila clavipes]